jgi:hypothetical protein
MSQIPTEHSESWLIGFLRVIVFGGAFVLTLYFAGALV